MSNLNYLFKTHFTETAELSNIRRKLRNTFKFKLIYNNFYYIVEGCPWDEEVVMCYNEITFEQYDIPLSEIDEETTTFIPKPFNAITRDINNVK